MSREKSALERFMPGTGFEAGAYGPPRNLGKCLDRSYELTVSSRVWGVDHYEGDVPIPRSFKVKADIALIGPWVFLHVDECLHPLNALKKSDFEPGKFDHAKVGESWYEYPWAWDDGVWEDGEYDAYPDRIYFEELLPKEVLEVGAVGSQHAIPIAEYKYTLDYLYEDKWYVNPGVQDTMGKLVIRDNGEMEIWGNYDWTIWKKTKYNDGTGDKLRVEDVTMVTNGFETHWPSKNYSKPGKALDTEDYYVGFHDFSIVFKLGGRTYEDEINNDTLTAEDVPTKKTASKLITKDGLDLDTYHRIFAEVVTNDDDSDTIDYKKHLRYNRLRAYLYKMADEYRKVYCDKNNPVQRAKLAELLKMLMDAFPRETAGFITSSDIIVQSSGSGDDGDSTMDTDP